MRRLAFVLLALALPLVAASPAPDEAYRKEIEAWRAHRNASLKREDGWLTLVGLTWLGEGRAIDAPNGAGTIRLEKGAATFVPSGSGVTVDGKPAPVSSLLKPDADGEPTVVRKGTISFYAIRRDDRIGIRVKDSEAKALKEFRGIESFPIDPAWRLTGRFERYEPPKKIEVPTVLGTTSTQDSPGAVVFQVAGKTWRLDVIPDEGDSLFLVFGDATNRKETYGGGRFLVAPPPTKDGSVVVDFNEAYNPPCVFSPYATCPQPPEQNRLPFRIEAGEKLYAEP